jgi:opacity protein-like surface antigen
MNRIHVACLLSLAICAPQSSAAETSPFTGFTLGATAGAARSSVDYSGYIGGKSSSKDDFVGSINAGYGFALGENVVLGIGAAYVLNSAEFGQVNYQEDGRTVYVDGKLKEHWSVFVAPGLRLAPQWLAYVKLGYHHARSEYTDTLVGSGRSDHHGFGYGAGFSYAAAKAIELNAEIQQVNLSSASFALSSGEPSVTELTVGINYRF